MATSSQRSALITLAVLALLAGAAGFGGNQWLKSRHADWEMLLDRPQQLWQATQGDAEAQYQIGRQYARQKNWQNAIAWYRKAAGQNHGKAQNNLGAVYIEGTVVTKNAELACDYFARAYTNLKDANSAANAGLCFDDIRSFKQAAHYYQIAAKGGEAQAKFKLARLYWQGAGVSQDYTLAVYWFRDAAIRHNDALAMASLSRMYLFGQGVSRRDPAAAYLLLKTAQAKANAEDRAILDNSQIDQAFLAKMENSLPPKLQQTRVVLENMAQTMSVAEIFAEIDKHTPYTPPVLPE